MSGPSAHCFRLHTHEEYSIGIVDQGEAMFHHAQGPEPVRARSVVLIEPGRWHACNPNRPLDWSYRMLFVKADWLHGQLGCGAITFPQRALHHAGAADLASRLCKPLEHAPDIARHRQWLLQFIELHAQCHDARPAHLEPEAVRDALRALHAQPDADISVQALAHAQGMSASRFIRQFKTATGVTPGAYRLNLRINGARRLLAEGATLAEAAHRMGFADQSHMQRSFRAHHALTPGNYAQTAVIQQHAA